MEGHGQVSYASALFVQEVESCIDREEKICSFIQDRDNFLVSVCPFPKDVEFLNCKKPLSFDENLKGKIVILDFFTYCCINCMHVLPGKLFNCGSVSQSTSSYLKSNDMMFDRYEAGKEERVWAHPGL